MYNCSICRSEQKIIWKELKISRNVFSLVHFRIELLILQSTLFLVSLVKYCNYNFILIFLWNIIRKNLSNLCINLLPAYDVILSCTSSLHLDEMKSATNDSIQEILSDVHTRWHSMGYSNRSCSGCRQ